MGEARVPHAFFVDSIIRKPNPTTLVFNKICQTAYNHAAEVKVRAERKAGELLKQLERSKGGDSRSFQDGASVSDYREVLNENKIPDTTAHRWQQLAEIPEICNLSATPTGF